MKKTLPTLFLLTTLLFSNTSFAYDKNGEYITGGGVGSISCAGFNMSIARANVVGGINSIKGSRVISSYINYILGFQTGHNSSHLGKKDVLKKFGSTPTNKLLPLIEEWCKSNPEENFGNALVTVVKRVNESDEDYSEPENKGTNLFGI